MAKAEIKQSVPVFVSSTYEDLIPYRNEVQRVLVRLEQIVKGMEYFGSNPKKPLDVCLETVKSCKVFVGIIGMRYGSVEKETKKSFTQLEYEEAKKNRIPILIYIIDENHPISPKFVDKDENARRLSDFKDMLTQNHIVSYFNTPENLGQKLTSDLIDVLKSLNQIEIDFGAEKDIKEDFINIYKKFLFRPAKYKSQEGILTIRISDKYKSGENIRASIQSGLGLTIGDTVCLSVYVIDEKTFKNIDSIYSYLYGDKKMGDWLEQVKPETIAKVKVRLEYIVIKEVEKSDNGSILKESGWPSLILLDVLSENI
jgi:hypothetical protein